MYIFYIYINFLLYLYTSFVYSEWNVWHVHKVYNVGNFIRNVNVCLWHCVWYTIRLVLVRAFTGMYTCKVHVS